MTRVTFIIESHKPRLESHTSQDSNHTQARLELCMGLESHMGLESLMRITVQEKHRGIGHRLGTQCRFNGLTILLGCRDTRTGTGKVRSGKDRLVWQIE